MNVIRCFQVDAFTSRPFAGNPAAVCLLEEEADATWMQAVAAEMNLSETAFVRPLDESFCLRWFTPKVEVDLCGHATLAAAHVLWSQGIAGGAEPIRFHTRSGVLSAAQSGLFIEMDFPATPATQCQPPAGLLPALGAAAHWVGRARFDYLVVLESEEAVRGLAPDFRQLCAMQTRGVIVTARSNDAGYDFVSRFFAPNAGIDEDPVTGSAHCCLAPYWAEQLGRLQLTGYQASARGGVVQVRVSGDRAILGGQAILVWEGKLKV